MVNIWKCVVVSTLAATAALAQAPPQERRAALAGGNPNGPGKCTIEIVADLSAEVEIRGDRAVLRTTGGYQAQWRRFQCNVPLPENPVNFRFEGIDGRGSQQLRQAAGAGRPAIIHIDDTRPGTEGYTFDIIWNGAAGPPPPPIFNGSGGDRRDGDRRDRVPPPFQADDAIRACQDAVIDQAARRSQLQGFTFRGTRIDDGPGRNDWVIGFFDVRRGRDVDTYRFSCSVDFGGRRIRSADFDRVNDHRR
jgi:hypothetical protein